MILIAVLFLVFLGIGIALYFTVFKKNKKQMIKFSGDGRNKVEYDNLFYSCNNMEEFIRQVKIRGSSKFKVPSVICKGIDNKNTLYGKQGMKDDHFLFKKDNSKWKGFVLLNEKKLKNLAEFKSYYAPNQKLNVEISEARKKMLNDFDKGVYYGIEISS